MEGTEAFKQQIKTHLDGIAAEDAMFAQKYSNKKKNLDDCVTYILAEVFKSGKSGYTDPEVFGLAIHYYDEENIVVNKNIEAEKVHIVSNYNTTKEDEAAAKVAALKRLEQEAYERLKAKNTTKKATTEVEQPTLF